MIQKSKLIIKVLMRKTKRESCNPNLQQFRNYLDLAQKYQWQCQMTNIFTTIILWYMVHGNVMYWSAQGSTGRYCLFEEKCTLKSSQVQQMYQVPNDNVRIRFQNCYLNPYYIVHELLVQNSSQVGVSFPYSVKLFIEQIQQVSLNNNPSSSCVYIRYILSC